LPLGGLKQKIMQVTEGRKIVYVVDTAFTRANADKIVELASGADILFIEATFLDADRERATARHHLTARQAGTLARQARVKRLVTFHHSPRYRDCRSLLLEEAEAAFRGTRAFAGARAASECGGTAGQGGDDTLP
jgi:ribonuclease Z